MCTERTTVGLDVHARSVVAEAVDWATGQVFGQRLVPANDVVLGWVAQLPGPVAVAYEAGPTGFGLARAFGSAGVRCEVVAPSKLQRPPGDRVKTDRRDARRLARLLHIGEIVGIRIPSGGRGGRPGPATGSSTTAARPGPGYTNGGYAPNTSSCPVPGRRSTTPSTRCWR